MRVHAEHVQLDSEDERYVYVEGRRLLRARGGESVEADAPESEGESQGEPGLGLYDLDAVPEELRPLMMEELKKVERNVTSKFQEHADFRKKFEGLEEIEGLTDVPAEELTELMEFRQLIQDPEQFEAWWHQVGDELGLLEPEEDDDGSVDLDEMIDEDEGDGIDQSALDTLGEQLLARIDERLSPLEQRLAAQDTEARQAAAKEEVDSQFQALRDKHGDFNEEAVSKLAFSYEGAPDAIERAYQDYLSLTGGAQSDLVEQKLDQPSQSNGQGRPDTTPESFDGLSDPALKKAARSRFAAAS